MRRCEAPATADTLWMDLVYLSPRGKRCVLVPGRPLPWLEFRYLDQPTLGGDGFYLRRHLFHRVMREAPKPQALAGYLAAIRS